MNTLASHPGSRTPALPSVSLSAQNVSVWFQRTRVLHNVSLDIPEHQVTAFIGPSGCGKSTLLRCFNRLNELVEGSRTEGVIRLGGIDIHGPDVDHQASIDLPEKYH